MGSAVKILPGRNHRVLRFRLISRAFHDQDKGMV
jgi:hypothetical protein